jgi:hypothetical protein
MWDQQNEVVTGIKGESLSNRELVEGSRAPSDEMVGQFRVVISRSERTTFCSLARVAAEGFVTAETIGRGRTVCGTRGFSGFVRASVSGSVVSRCGASDFVLSVLSGTERSSKRPGQFAQARPTSALVLPQKSSVGGVSEPMKRRGPICCGRHIEFAVGDRFHRISWAKPLGM